VTGKDQPGLEERRVKDVISLIEQQKWRWEGHVARINDNGWTRRLTDRHPYYDKRSRKRPDTKWRDEIKKNTGVAWQRIAQNR